MASTYNASADGNQNITITPVVGSTVTVLLPDADYSIVHLNIQNDGSTASVATDYIVIMNSQTPSGTAVTMAANYNDGINGKMIVAAGASASANGSAVPLGPDGPREIQIQAVGHGCKAQIIRGHHGG